MSAGGLLGVGKLKLDLLGTVGERRKDRWFEYGEEL